MFLKHRSFAVYGRGSPCEANMRSGPQALCNVESYRPCSYHQLTLGNLLRDSPSSMLPSHSTTPETWTSARAAARSASPLSIADTIAACSAMVRLTASCWVRPRQMRARSVGIETDPTIEASTWLRLPAAIAE